MATTTRQRSLKMFALAGATAVSLWLPSHGSADNWQRCNRADVKALKVFTVGEAALYRKDCDSPDLLRPPLKLAFQYFREVPGDAFGEAAMHFLEKNLDVTQFNALQPSLSAFNQHYQDVDDGDRYTLVYEQGGLTLALNGTPLTRQEGDEFARAYLTIWFGPSPYSPAMKESLLGLR